MRRIRAVMVVIMVAVLALATFYSTTAADQEVSKQETAPEIEVRAQQEGDAILNGIRAAESEAARLAEEAARKEEEAKRAAEVALAAQRERERVSTPTTTKAARYVSAPSGDVWAALRQCESGGNYQANTGNGYYGAYQFSASTWRSMGTGYAYAHEAPPAIQDDAARRLQARSGWGQWPTCSRKLGLR